MKELELPDGSGSTGRLCNITSRAIIRILTGIQLVENITIGNLNNNVTDNE